MEVVNNRNNSISNSLPLYLILFVILFLSGSYLTSNDIIPPNVTKVLWISIVFIIIIVYRKSISISKRIIVSLFVLMGIVFLSTIINKGNLINSSFFCISIIISLLVTSTWSFEVFKNAYNKVLLFLSIVSLFMMLVFYIFPSINSLFHVSNKIGTAIHCNFIIFTKIANERGFGRNCGMFWEPGAFQTFLCIALIFEITNKRPSIRKIIVFILTILTTFSTTGYICLMVILFYMMINNYRNEKRIRLLLFLIIISLIVLLYVGRDLFFSLENYTTFGKLILYNTSSAYRDRISSVSIRINAFFQPIVIFYNNFLFGVGDIAFQQLTYDTTLGVTSCTFLNWFAIYGIFVGAFFVICAAKLSYKIAGKKTLSVIVFLILFLTTASENFVSNTAILILMLYGINDKYAEYYPRVRLQ